MPAAEISYGTAAPADSHADDAELWAGFLAMTVGLAKSNGWGRWNSGDPPDLFEPEPANGLSQQGLASMLGPSTPPRVPMSGLLAPASANLVRSGCDLLYAAELDDLDAIDVWRSDEHRDAAYTDARRRYEECLEPSCEEAYAAELSEIESIDVWRSLEDRDEAYAAAQLRYTSCLTRGRQMEPKLCLVTDFTSGTPCCIGSAARECTPPLVSTQTQLPGPDAIAALAAPIGIKYGLALWFRNADEEEYYQCSEDLIRTAWAILVGSLDLAEYAMCVAGLGADQRDCLRSKILSWPDEGPAVDIRLGGSTLVGGVTGVTFNSANLFGGANINIATTAWSDWNNLVWRWCDPSASDPDRACIAVDVASIFLHELGHLCGLSLPTDGCDSCAAVLVMEHAFRWAMLERFSFARDSACCRNIDLVVGRSDCGNTSYYACP